MINLPIIISGSDIMKKKTMDIIAYAISAGAIGAGCYLMLKEKKNMLDVIIEEIETIK